MDAYPRDRKLRDLTQNAHDAFRELNDAIKAKREADAAVKKATDDYARHSAALLAFVGDSAVRS
jgi:hypothetical protein